MSIDLELGPRCPMCGMDVAAADTSCAHCGEPLVPESPDELAVPIYSLKLIGVCTFLWNFMAGCLLLWLNSRKLGLQRESQHVVIFGAIGFVVLMAVSVLMPEGVSSMLVVNLVATVVLVKFGHRLLGKQFEQQRQQRGPYASTWKAHGISLLVALLMLAVVIGFVVVLGELGLFEEV